jgi:hypothetical protein
MDVVPVIFGSGQRYFGDSAHLLTPLGQPTQSA